MAFRKVILACSAIVMVVGALVWFFLKLDHRDEQSILLDKISLPQLRQVLGLRSVWLLMVIILCAYVGYKITDVFSLYAKDIMGYDQVDSAQVGTFLLFIRPVSGVLIGILADRTDSAFWLLVSFIVAVAGSLIFATGILEGTATILFFLSIFILASGIYAARALYFAVMQQGRIPLVLTGTAVGLISLVGYTPDIFVGPAMGYLLDEFPGAAGHRMVFWMFAFFSTIGGVAAWMYYKRYRIRKGSTS